MSTPRRRSADEIIRLQVQNQWSERSIQEVLQDKTIMKALVLAAGLGNRLRPLTDHTPKPMMNVGGMPILERNIRLLASHGISEIVINVHHLHEKISDHFGTGEPWGVNITYSHEPELLGTAGAAKNVQEYLTETFVVIYGDNLTNCNLTNLIAFHRAKGGTGTIALFHKEDPTSNGIAEFDSDDRIKRFLEKPDQHEVFSQWISAGVLVLEPEILSSVPTDYPSDFGRDTIPLALANGLEFYGYRMNEGLWWIDTPSDYYQLKKRVEEEGLVIW